ncbi:MAG: YdcF family protein [Polaromonas sp.]
MFYFSKLLSIVTQPLIWAAVLFLLALWLRPRWPVTARWVLLPVVGMALMGWLRLPDALLRELENRHPAPAAVVAGQLQPYIGLVVLGGEIERQKVAVELLRQHPHLQLLFTGGNGNRQVRGSSEADQAEAFFIRMGVPAERTLYERASRTTYENAAFGAAVPGVDITQPWLLITAASHMPRALAIFRAAGWNVTPYPVDYRTGIQSKWTEYSLARGAYRWRLVLHEWVGLAAYAAAGMLQFFECLTPIAMKNC